jgi:hypothetical protein
MNNLNKSCNLDSETNVIKVVSLAFNCILGMSIYFTLLLKQIKLKKIILTGN